MVIKKTIPLLNLTRLIQNHKKHIDNRGGLPPLLFFRDKLKKGSKHSFINTLYEYKKQQLRISYNKNYS